MSEVQTLHGKEGIARIAELIKDIHICMMTTMAPNGGFDSRPMATQKADFDGSLWFLTRRESGKVAEIKDDDRIGLMYADTSDSKYISINGHATVSRDAEKIKELWNPMYKAWFPAGEDDPAIAVLRVDVSDAHYWSASSSRLILGVKYLAAAVTGGKVDVGEQGEITV